MAWYLKLVPKWQPEGLPGRAEDRGPSFESTVRRRPSRRGSEEIGMFFGPPWPIVVSGPKRPP